MSNKRYLSTKEAARRIGRATVTLRLWRSQGRGPACHRVEGRWVYDARELDRFLRGGGLDAGELRHSDVETVAVLEAERDALTVAFNEALNEFGDVT